MADVNVTPEVVEEDLNEILRIRRAKLKDLVDAGENPFEKVRFDFDTYFLNPNITSYFQL